MSFILYGSQTGQAKAIAEDLHKTLKTKNSDFKLCELDEIDKSFFLEKINIIIIICSTTGDGDAPENASKFLRKIKSYPINFFSPFKFTVLGLGDTNYSNFCLCGKSIDTILCKIGGTRFYHSSWADDAIGLELVIEPWLEGLYKVILDISGDELVATMKMITVSDIAPQITEENILTVSELLGDKEAEQIGYIGLSIPLLPEPFLHIDYNAHISCYYNKAIVSNASLPADKSGIKFARISEMKRITEKYAIKSVHKVTLSFDSIDWNWLPGDSLGVLPSNPQSEVDAILTRLGVSINDRKCLISLKLIPNLSKKSSKIPEHLIVAENVQMSLHNVLSWLVDIRSPLSKVGLRIMAEFCLPNGSEQRRLLQLCSKEGQMLYIKCIREPCMPILDLLNCFPSCNIPIARLIEVLPRLKPRAYSLCDIDSLSFAFSKVDIAPVPAFRKRPLTGICTTWLESLMARDSELTIPIYLRKNLNAFTVSNPQDPHILIGPGTGVAPFIAFLQYFEKLKNEGVSIGPIWLFFGCRNLDRDFIFREQLQYFVTAKVLSHLCVCFSRDSWCETSASDTVCCPRDCKYVQDCMVYHGPELATLVLDGGARVFVCGDAAGLARDVLSTWSTVLLSSAHTHHHTTISSKKDADGYIAKMRIDRLYLEDVWL